MNLNFAEKYIKNRQIADDMINIYQMLRLLKLAFSRNDSKQAYFDFQAYQGELVLSELKGRGVDLKNKRILDLGCGIGGYSLQFYKEARELTAADIKKPEILLRRCPRIKFLKFDACKKFPIKSKKFDLVFCSSTIEHVGNPLFMLKEINRVLDKDGKLILTFPPFYSPVGGHTFKPFHYLGERMAIRINNLLRKQDVKFYWNAYGDWGLYPLRIADVGRLLNKAGFKIVDKWTRYFPINAAKIPVLNEVLTWHVNFLCEKAKR